MTIFAKLGLGFATMLLTFCMVGGLSIWYLSQLHDADARVRTRVALNEIALAYRHGAEDATLGASQLASGNVIGEQRIAEGTAEMAESRRLLAGRLTTDEERAELRELERVERLTVAGTERVVALVRAKSAPELIRQELAFLSARADALNLRLLALSDDTREDMLVTMALSAALGQRVQSNTGIALAGCLVFSVLVSVLVFRSIAPPLTRLEEGVRHLAGGNMGHRIPVTSNDEIGQLTRAFNDMTTGLKGAMDALDARNRDMRIVLDHVNQGLVTMERDGTLSRERSRMVDLWLGEVAPAQKLWEHMAGLDAHFAASFQMNWDQVLENVMPIELTLDQMPRRLRGRDVELELEYQPIMDGDQVSKLLIVISDIGDRLARERARAHEQEVFAIFQAIQRDKQGFLDFFSEGGELVASLAAAASTSRELSVIKRQVHTLKGNSAIFGICSVARTCHELETHMEESEALAGAELDTLCSQWSELAGVVAKLVGDSGTRIEIDDEEYAAILTAIAGGQPRREIAGLVSQWRMERVQPRLERFGEQARSLAERLGKGPIAVSVEAQLPRLPRASFAPFWGSLVHALRNAVDHGLETHEERSERGKPGDPALMLRTRIVDDELAVEVEDNGRGIAWDRIAQKARERGLPADTMDDLTMALFSDGVSTADAVTDVSGRGVGMAALRDACTGLSGRIVIDSELGRGTTLSFRFPLRIALAQVELSLPIANTNSLPDGIVALGDVSIARS